MARNAILQLKGFDDLLEQIQKAGGSVDRAAESCMRQSAQIMHTELQAKMQAAGVDGGLIGSMSKPQVKVEGNVYEAEVGYKKGAYDPRNPSAAHKVVFLNYGTPRRKKHGKVAERGFIAVAKKSARPRIKKAQKETLEKILGRVNK